MRIARRRFLQSSALAPLAAAQDGLPANAPPADVTRKLARYVVKARLDDVPAAVRKEAAPHAGQLDRVRRRRLAS